MRRIATVGEILVEVMAARVGQAFATPGELLGPYPSGAPAIFADQAARLGQPSGIVAAVGDDEFGALNLARLEASGVDVSAVSVAAGWPTGTAFVRYLPDGTRRFVFNIARSAAGQVALGPQARALLERADHLHIAGTSLVTPKATAAVLGAVEIVKGRGGTLSFDPNLRPELLSEALRCALEGILERCDLFLPSGPELLLLTRAQDEAGAVAELLGRGVREVVWKRGAEGAVHFDREGRTECPGFAVEEVDPTGAGDCFAAGFVSFRLRGVPPAEALRRACACGALAVTRRGPMEGTPTLAELERFLAGDTA